MRTLTTADELNELAPMSIVLEPGGFAWQKDHTLEFIWHGIGQDHAWRDTQMLELGPLRAVYEAPTAGAALRHEPEAAHA